MLALYYINILTLLKFKKGIHYINYSDIHKYISYASNAWGNTYLSNLKKKSIANKNMQCV